jgi:hypothetical protein
VIDRQMMRGGYTLGRVLNQIYDHDL